MKFQFGAITIDPPEGWEDRSTVLLVAPPEQALAAPLSGRPTPSYRRNVGVSYHAKLEGITSAEQYLDGMTAQLRSVGITPHRHEWYPGKVGRHEGWWMVHTVDLDGTRVRQVTACVVTEIAVIIATGSMPESNEKKPIEELKRVISGIEIR